MDNAQKAIMIGVAIFITVIIITLVLLITNIGINTTKKPLNTAGAMSQSLMEQLTTQYDRKLVTGQDVLYCLEQNESTVVKVGLVPLADPTNIYVMNNSGAYAGGYAQLSTDQTFYQRVTSSLINSLPINTSSKNTLKSYVSTNKSYKSYLYRDSDTSELLGVVFVEQSSSLL